MIQKNWQELIRPINPEIQPSRDPERKAIVTVEPLERGFGMTLGNALRRVLLSSLQGAAISAVQIDGVVHEFESLPGIREDVTNIVLNLKGLAIRMHGKGVKKLRLRKTGAGPVTGADIEETADVEILNKDYVIFTANQDADIRMELTVTTGKGYVPAATSRPDDAPAGLISIDALYSPVKRVAYRVEDTRDGHALDYDKLIIDVETNGAVSPVDAVAIAARILQDQSQVFVNFDDPEDVGRDEEKPKLDFNPLLLRKVDEFELSVRSTKSLKNDNIVYIGDLIQKSEAEMLRTPNFGRKSLNEIKEVLAVIGLHLGMNAPNWPPENIEELSRLYDKNEVFSFGDQVEASAEYDIGDQPDTMVAVVRQPTPLFARTKVSGGAKRALTAYEALCAIPLEY